MWVTACFTVFRGFYCISNSNGKPTHDVSRADNVLVVVCSSQQKLRRGKQTQAVEIDESLREHACLWSFLNCLQLISFQQYRTVTRSPTLSTNRSILVRTTTRLIVPLTFSQQTTLHRWIAVQTVTTKLLSPSTQQCRRVSILIG